MGYGDCQEQGKVIFGSSLTCLLDKLKFNKVNWIVIQFILKDFGDNLVISQYCWLFYVSLHLADRNNIGLL